MLGIDAITDMFRTATNVTGDMTGAVVLGRRDRVRATAPLRAAVKQALTPGGRRRATRRAVDVFRAGNRPHSSSPQRGPSSRQSACGDSRSRDLAELPADPPHTRRWSRSSSPPAMSDTTSKRACVRRSTRPTPRSKSLSSTIDRATAPGRRARWAAATRGERHRQRGAPEAGSGSRGRAAPAPARRPVMSSASPTPTRVMAEGSWPAPFVRCRRTRSTCSPSRPQELGSFGSSWYSHMCSG